MLRVMIPSENGEIMPMSSTVLGDALRFGYATPSAPAILYQINL